MIHNANYRSLRLVIISSIALLLLSLTVFSAWDSYNGYQLIIAHVEAQSQSYARALKEHAERTFSEIDLAVRSAIHQIESAGGPDKLNRQQLEHLLRSNNNNIPQIGSLVFIDRSGQMRANSLPDLDTLPSVAHQQFYRLHRDNRSQEIFINPPFKSSITGKWRFTLSRRISAPSGAFAGILAAAVEISYFEKLYISVVADKNNRFSLATSVGDYLVLVPSTEEVYRTSKKTAEFFRKLVKAKPVGTYHNKQSNIAKEYRIVSYNQLDRYPVVAIMSFSKDQAVAEWRSSTIKRGLTIGLLGLLIIILTRLLLRQIKLLDHKVQERTSLLSLSNRFLEKEIEERKQVETDLIQNQQKLDRMAGELSLAEDRERGRIAGELHDQVGQRLIFCKIRLDQLTSEAGCKESLELITDIETLVDQSLQDIRSLTFQLRPPILASAGLLAALQWLAEELQRDYGLEVKFDACHYGASLQSLRYEISSTLFQTVRELLLNVVKHAGVSVAWVSLHLTEELLLIKVIDNGKGFDTIATPAASSRQGGFGMYNLHKKLEFLGGSCLIESSPGSGTFVTLSLPLKPELFEET
jgi:signal transduction histidine kinase